MTYAGKSVSDETQQRVLSALEREADLDGVVIVGEEYLAKQLGLTGATVGVAIHQLAEKEQLVIEGLNASRGHARIIQLKEF
jgi:hypothetical protein